MQGNLKEAIANYRQVLQQKPDSAAALNDLAWILATAPQAELRNGPEAVGMAERACRLGGAGNARFLGTLAAAYAEAGRFPEAVKTAEQARDLAVAAGEKSLAEGTEARLARYRRQQPYRQ
jgi:Flp pilus assembly protein TadD